MILLVVYPIVYTVYVSVTNYGTGNILTKRTGHHPAAGAPHFRCRAGNYTYQAYRDGKASCGLFSQGPKASCFWAMRASSPPFRKAMPAWRVWPNSRSLPGRSGAGHQRDFRPVLCLG